MEAHKDELREEETKRVGLQETLQTPGVPQERLDNLEDAMILCTENIFLSILSEDEVSSKMTIFSKY